MPDVLTTESVNKLFKCDVCRARVPILVQRVDRKRVCIACLPPKDRAVFGQK